MIETKGSRKTVSKIKVCLNSVANPFRNCVSDYIINSILLAGGDDAFIDPDAYIRVAIVLADEFQYK